MAELYEELKNRISQFNMYVDCRRPVMDQEYVHKQRFILQVCWGFLDVSSPPFSRLAVVVEKAPNAFSLIQMMHQEILGPWCSCCFGGQHGSGSRVMELVTQPHCSSPEERFCSTPAVVTASGEVLGFLLLRN